MRRRGTTARSWPAAAGLFGGKASSVPFYKALLQRQSAASRRQPRTAALLRELGRPALGWIYAENYIKSSPGIPHAFHMQAHLAMRLGRWDKTSDRSAHAIEMERAYHKEMGVKPAEDSSISHHLETLLRR